MAYLHHLAIHFPIALSALAALVAVFALFRREPSRAPQIAAILAVAALATVVAAISGLLCANHVIEGGGDPAKVALHRNLALGASAATLIAAGLAWRESRSASPTPALPVVAVVAIVAAGAVSAAAHFGGELLHAGMAPWSAQPHSHGRVGAGGDDHHGAQGAPTGVAGHEDDHDRGAVPDHADAAPDAAQQQEGGAAGTSPPSSAAPPAPAPSPPTGAGQAPPHKHPH